MMHRDMKRLNVLELRNNSLRELPDSISELNGLTKLDLSNNLLRDIPKSMANMRQLKTLDLRGNNLKTELKSQLYKSIPSLMLYLQQDTKGQ